MKSIIQPVVKSVVNQIVMEGRVKFFNHSKGYGFIKPKDEEAEDIYVHVSGTLDKVVEGDAVTYEVDSNVKGLIATQVRRKK